MADRINIEWAVNVYKTPKDEILRRAVRKAPWINKILQRLPERYVRRIYRDDYTVTERMVEKGFVFMNLNDLAPGGRILDVGCAWSSLPFEFAGLGFKVWGMDISDYPFSHPGLISIKGSVCSSGLESDFFDAVTAVSTVEHIGLGWYGDDVKNDSDIKAVREIRRMLKPSGKFILTVPYGVRTSTHILRVYDRAALAGLTDGFEIIRASYFVNHMDKYWSFSDERRAAGMGVNSRGRNEGNVCMALRKI